MTKFTHRYCRRRRRRLGARLILGLILTVASCFGLLLGGCTAAIVFRRGVLDGLLCLDTTWNSQFHGGVIVPCTRSRAIYIFHYTRSKNCKKQQLKVSSVRFLFIIANTQKKTVFLSLSLRKSSSCSEFSFKLTALLLARAHRMNLITTTKNVSKIFGRYLLFFHEGENNNKARIVRWNQKKIIVTQSIFLMYTLTHAKRYLSSIQ